MGTIDFVGDDARLEGKLYKLPHFYIVRPNTFLEVSFSDLRKVQEEIAGFSQLSKYVFKTLFVFKN